MYYVIQIDIVSCTALICYMAKHTQWPIFSPDGIVLVALLAPCLRTRLDGVACKLCDFESEHGRDVKTHNDKIFML